MSDTVTFKSSIMHSSDGRMAIKTHCGFYALLNRFFSIPAVMLIISLALLAAIQTASAQVCPSPHSKRLSQTPIIKDMVNPTPVEGDIELPMPCGGKMILRPVCVPAQHYLSDQQLHLGCENCGRPDQGFMEAKRIAALAGTFTLDELPDTWRVKLHDLARNGVDHAVFVLHDEI